MPALVVPPLPQGVGVVVQVVGSAASVEIIRYLALYGPARRADIQSAVTASAPTLGRLLSALVQHGVLVTNADVHQGRGRGKKYTYSLDRDRIRQMMAEVAEYLLADPPQCPPPPA